MQRFKTLHPATPPSRSRRFARQLTPASRSPSRRASPSAQRSSHRQSALDANALQGAPLPAAARPLAQDPRATAHQLAISARIASPVPLSAAQQSHQLAPPPLARFVCTSPTSLEPLVPSASLVSALLAQSQIWQRAHSRGFCSRRSLSRRCLSRCCRRFLRLYSTLHSICRAQRASQALWWCRLRCNRAPHRRCSHPRRFTSRLLPCSLRRKPERR